MDDSEEFVKPAEINAAFQYAYLTVEYLRQASEYRRRADYKNWFESLMIASNWVSIKMSEKEIKKRSDMEAAINALFVQWQKLNIQEGPGHALETYRPLYLALDEFEVWIRKIGDRGGLIGRYSGDDDTTATY